MWRLIVYLVHPVFVEVTRFLVRSRRHLSFMEAFCWLTKHWSHISSMVQEVWPASASWHQVSLQRFWILTSFERGLWFLPVLLKQRKQQKLEDKKGQSTYINWAMYLPTVNSISILQHVCWYFFPSSSWILSQVKTVLDLPGLNFASLTGLGRLLFFKHLRIVE